jgi:hypothetical protein
LVQLVIAAIITAPSRSSSCLPFSWISAQPVASGNFFLRSSAMALSDVW